MTSLVLNNRAGPDLQLFSYNLVLSGLMLSLVCYVGVIGWVGLIYYV